MEVQWSQTHAINPFYHHWEGKQMELTSASYLEVMVQPLSHQDPPSDEIWYFSLYSLEVWGWGERERESGKNDLLFYHSSGLQNLARSKLLVLTSKKLALKFSTLLIWISAPGPLSSQHLTSTWRLKWRRPGNKAMVYQLFTQWHFVYVIL